MELFQWSEGLSRQPHGTQNWKHFRSFKLIELVELYMISERCVWNVFVFRLKAIVFITVAMSTYEDQLKAGFSKVCEICKFSHRLLKNVFGCFTLSVMAYWGVLGYSKRPRFPDLLLSVWSSGLRKTRQADVCLKCEVQEFVLDIAYSSLYFLKIIDQGGRTLHFPFPVEFLYIIIK